MQPRYFRPMVVISCNKGGAYILCDMNGTLMHTPTIAFRVVPYFTRKHLDLPDLKQHLNVFISWLWELENSTTTDPDDHGMLKATDYSNSSETAKDIDKNKPNV